MRKLILSAAALALLSACSGDPAKDAATVNKDFAMACWGYSAAKASFVAFSASGKVDATGMKKAQDVEAALDPLCAGPAPANVQDAVAKLLVGAAQLAAIVAPVAVATAHQKP